MKTISNCWHTGGRGDALAALAVMLSTRFDTTSVAHAFLADCLVTQPPQSTARSHPLDILGLDSRAPLAPPTLPRWLQPSSSLQEVRLRLLLLRANPGSKLTLEGMLVFEEGGGRDSSWTLASNHRTLSNL